MNFLCRANLALPVAMNKAHPIFHRQSRWSFSIAHSLIDKGSGNRGKGAVGSILLVGGELTL